MIDQRKKRRILVVNMQDTVSREFISSLTADEWLDYDLFIDWYNPEHLPLVQEYLLDRHYPSPSVFPTIWAELPREFTYGDNDQVVRISPKDGNIMTHRDVINCHDSAMVDAITENVMMSESYKINYILESIMLMEGVTSEVIARFSICKSVDQIKIMHQKMVSEGIFIKDESLIAEVKQETGVNLGETVVLTIPEKPAPLPANFHKRKISMLVDKG